MSGWSTAGVVRERAAADPAAPLFVVGTKIVEAAQFEDRTNRVGQALLGAGCKATDRVGFIGHNELAWYELFFGAAKAGIVAVGLSWRLSTVELIAVASDAGMRLIVGGPGAVDETRSFDDTAAAVGAAMVPPAVVVSSHDWARWSSAGSPEDPAHCAGPDDTALHLYTSGTTGAAKGVLLSHRAVEASLAAARSWQLRSGASALVNLPLAHFGGTGWPVWALALGARCVLHRDVDAATAVEAFHGQVTTTLAVPQILRSLCDEADRTGGGPFETLECIGYGSAPITEDLLLRTMRTFDCDLVQTYGMTETCGVLTQLGPDDHDPAGPRRHLLRSAGRPVDGVSIRIGLPTSSFGDGGSAGDGAVGDLYVRAPWLMTGYWNRPEATSEVLADDGWFATGDIGFLDAEGYLYLTDRASDMIITGGENVYPAEVEAVLARHPGVVDVAVLGVPDVRWGETIVAVVVVDAVLSPPTEADLLAFARSQLAHFKCPTRILTARQLPRNPTGKVLRRSLRDLFAS